MLEHNFWILCCVLAYLTGAIPFGYLLGRLKGIDIRQHGSQNIGATNVLRVLGKPWGYGCFLLDFAKGALPVFGTVWLVGRLDAPATLNQFAPAVAAAATIIGHIWPVYLKFKGGKGVATTVGALAVLAPLPVLVTGLVWLATFKASRYVSLASIAAAISLPLAALAMHLAGATPFPFLRQETLQQPTLILIALAGGLIILKHHANIKRLLQGTENRFARKTPSAG